MRVAASTPNLGAGTLALAARRNGRRWLLVETVPRYVEMARRRLAADE
jgi:DNA modification methylase